MSTGARIGVLVATVVVLGLAFVLLSPEADDDSNTAQTPTTTTPATATTDAPATTTTPPPPPPPATTFETSRVAAGEPAGGIRRIPVKKGERARIQVTTSDTIDEVHLHGYDITRDLRPGSRARFSFDANAEGIFEIELHDSHTQIGELTFEH